MMVDATVANSVCSTIFSILPRSVDSEVRLSGHFLVVFAFWEFDCRYPSRNQTDHNILGQDPTRIQQPNDNFRI